MRFVVVVQVAGAAGVLPLAGCAVVFGVNPPWNQPHETPFAESKSPTFLFVGRKPIFSAPLQSSYQGSGSPMTSRFLYARGHRVACRNAPRFRAGSAPPVMPEIT